MFLTASFLRICTYQHLTHRIVFNSFTNRIFFNSLATRSHQRFHKDRFPAIAQTHSNFKLVLRYTLPPPFSWQAYLGFFVLARIFYEHSWRANIGCRVNSTKKKEKNVYHTRKKLRSRNCKNKWFINFIVWVLETEQANTENGNLAFRFVITVINFILCFSLELIHVSLRFVCCFRDRMQPDGGVVSSHRTVCGMGVFDKVE